LNAVIPTTTVELLASRNQIRPVVVDEWSSLGIEPPAKSPVDDENVSDVQCISQYRRIVPSIGQVLIYFKCNRLNPPGRVGGQGAGASNCDASDSSLNFGRLFQFSVLPQPAVAATATAESVPSASANASNPESPRNITDTPESGATSPCEAVAESKEESIAFLPEHLVPEPASPVSGSAVLRAASAMAFVSDN